MHHKIVALLLSNFVEKQEVEKLSLYIKYEIETSKSAQLSILLSGVYVMWKQLLNIENQYNPLLTDFLSGYQLTIIITSS